MKSLKRLLLNNVLLLALGSLAWAGQMSGGDFVITKDLLGAAGPHLTPTTDSTDYSLGFAWGEPASGHAMSEPTYTVISGYYGGRFGSGQTFQMISSLVGAPNTKTFFQDQLQVGVHLDAPVHVTFSDDLNVNALPAGIQVVLATDHLGQSSNQAVPFTVVPDSDAKGLTVTPQTPWFGNTLYDIQLTPDLLSVDGFQLDQVYHVYFITVLNPHQDNVVLNPILPTGQASSAGGTPVGPMSIDIPLDSLADYSAVLMSRNPLLTPLHVDPKIIQEANAKARAAGGAYRVPIAIQEITAYNTNGELMSALSKPVSLSLNYGTGFSAPSVGGSLIRPQTLSLWALDETHSLWVKLPASRNTLGATTVSATVAHFAVYALMGSADGSTADTFAFPVPWRPHGPNAGTGPGQTGTEADGILFSNLPSESTIKIYTISGELVRTLTHSDTTGLLGQEKWDVKTSGGDPVASGVYLWRVDSSVDGKNGKLMVIR